MNHPTVGGHPGPLGVRQRATGRRDTITVNHHSVGPGPIYGTWIEVCSHASMARAGRRGSVGVVVEPSLSAPPPTSPTNRLPWLDMTPAEAEATALALLLSAAEARAATGDYS